MQATRYIITTLNKKKEKHKVCKLVCEMFFLFHSIFTPTSLRRYLNLPSENIFYFQYKVLGFKRSMCA